MAVSLINPDLVKLARFNLAQHTKAAFVPTVGGAPAAGGDPAMGGGDPAAAGGMPQAPAPAAMPPEVPEPGSETDPNMLQQAMSAAGVSDMAGAMDKELPITMAQIIMLVKAVTGKDGKGDSAENNRMKAENAKLKSMLGIPDLTEDTEQANPASAMQGAAPAMAGAGAPAEGAMKAGAVTPDSVRQLLRRLRTA